MTAEFKKGLLWTKPSSVARTITKAIDKRKDEVYAPAYWWGIMLLINSIPTKLFKRLTKK
jgi:hypothetical protein